MFFLCGFVLVEFRGGIPHQNKTNQLASTFLWCISFYSLVFFSHIFWAFLKSRFVYNQFYLFCFCLINILVTRLNISNIICFQVFVQIILLILQCFVSGFFLILLFCGVFFFRSCFNYNLRIHSLFVYLFVYITLLFIFFICSYFYFS